ncbi:hypothetical protein [Okeania sp. SIO2B3]|uniref:hypothetical protein n=1 Tax=Okeania sp. SIO2B3 TaxID=2607784 RepID=UPI0013C24D6C|nr:hypothetical protein [Okeania sp. SIO2B3]NET41473.1 hypothetical protein [Okeania sp. SIO2B3]
MSNKYRIEHKPLGSEVKISQGWLPESQVVVSVTSSASTPYKAVEDTITAVFIWVDHSRDVPWNVPTRFCL